MSSTPESSTPATTEDVLNARIVERRDLAEGLAIFRIAPENGGVAPFEPGQFATLGLPKIDSPDEPAPVRRRRSSRPRMTRRAYSIASSPHVREHLEFLVVLVEEGAFTPRLWDLEEGGRLFLDERINGEFTLNDVPHGKDLVMVSTGTGLAPYISMLRTYRGQERWRRLVIVHGTRYESDLAYREELEQAAREDPTVIYIPSLTREPEESNWTGARGRVQSLLEPDRYQELVGAPLDPAQCEVFLCGNPAMIDTVQGQLEERGFVTQTRKQPGNLHFERYW